MKKRTKILIIALFVILIILILAGIALYYSISGMSYKKASNGNGRRAIVNPAAGLSYEEAVAKFDDSFVYYLLYSIGANKLHTPFFSSDNPRIEFHIGDDIFNAEVADGSIDVGRGEILDEDIIIKTSKEEGVKMVLDTNYVQESFNNGLSEFELVAGKLELASKGYLKIYEGLTGEDIGDLLEF